MDEANNLNNNSPQQTPVDNTVQAGVGKTTPPTDPPAEQAQTPNPVEQPQNVENQVPPKPKKKFPVGVVLSVLGVLIVLSGIAFWFFKGRAGSSEKELVWWGVWYEEETINSFIGEYESNNPGVEIKYVRQSPKDYGERLMSALNGSSGPDIFQIHNTWTPMFVGKTSTVPGSIYSDEEFAETFYPVVSSDTSTGNGFAGIPLSFDAITLFVNEEIFERENLEVPVTWEDVGRISKTITKRNENEVITESGIAMGTTENVDHWQEILGLLFLQNGASLVSPGGELSEQTLNFYVSFGDGEDGSWDSTLPESTIAFSAGKVAMYIGPSWRAEEISAANPSLKFKTVPLPQLAKASPDQPDVSYATYWYESVSSNTNNESEAWKFLKFLSGKEAQEKLHAGSSKMLGISSRTDMNEEYLSNPITGSVARLAPEARSWYLASGTNDGLNGINTLVGGAYGKAIEGLRGRSSMAKVREVLVTDLNAVLQKYFDF